MMARPGHGQVGISSQAKMHWHDALVHKGSFEKARKSLDAGSRVDCAESGRRSHDSLRVSS